MDHSKETVSWEPVISAGDTLRPANQKERFSAAITQRPATIGESFVVKGELRTEEDLHFDGELEGKLNLGAHRLTVGSKGKVSASIRAGEVEIQGVVKGDIEVTTKIVIRHNARLIGNVKTAGIIIEEGAYFQGFIEIITAGALTNPV